MQKKNQTITIQVTAEDKEMAQKLARLGRIRRLIGRRAELTRRALALIPGRVELEEQGEKRLCPLEDLGENIE